MAGLLFRRKRSLTLDSPAQDNLLESLELEMQYLLNQTENGQVLLDQMEMGADERLMEKVEVYLNARDDISNELRAYLGS
jgi:hypothetical protein